MDTPKNTVTNPGPHGDEVPYTELKKGHDYYITKWSHRGDNWGKGRGVGFKAVEIYDGNPDLDSTKTGLSKDYVKKGDPLVTFESVEPTHEKTKSRLFDNVTYFKPYNGGAKTDIGYKFHNVNSIKHIASLALKDNQFPVEVKDYIGTFGGKRNKKKRRKTRRTRKRTRKSTRKRNKPRKTRRKRNRH